MNDEELRQTTSLEVQTDRESLTVVWQWFEQFSQTLIGDTIQWNVN